MIRVLKAEWLKQRKLPLVIPLLVVPLTLYVGCILIFNYSLGQGRTIDWVWSFLGDLLGMTWLYGVFLMIISYSSVAADVEHRGGMWVTSLLSPIPKWKHFLSKVILVYGCMQVLGLSAWLAFVAAGITFGDLSNPIIVQLFILVYGPFLLSLPYVVIQTLLSILFNHVYAPIGIGLFVLLFHPILTNFLLPWGPMLRTHAMNDWMIYILVVLTTVGYSALSFYSFERKSFANGAELS